MRSSCWVPRVVFYLQPGCQRTPLCLRQAAPVEAQGGRSAGSGRPDMQPGAGGLDSCFGVGNRCGEMAIHKGSEAGPCVRASGRSLTARLPSRGAPPPRFSSALNLGTSRPASPVTVVEAAAPGRLHLERWWVGHGRRWVTLCDFGLLYPGGGLFPSAGGPLSLSLPQLPRL